MSRQRVLFLCTGNSCRSQMAEGWLRHLAGDRFEAYSAGLEPHGLNPLAVQVMAEAGVDIGHHKSDPLDRYAGTAMDWFVTVCDRAREACPLTPAGSVTLHWSFDDPPTVVGAEALHGKAARDVYRRVRDEIRASVAAFIAADDAGRKAPWRPAAAVPSPTVDLPKVLVLCTHNSARSQLAEGLLRQLAGDCFEVHSAGLEPTQVHPLAVQVMDEIGIDLRGQRSKSSREYLGRVHLRYAIIVCAKAQQQCPTIFPGADEILVWPFEDPAVYATESEGLLRFRTARDEIETRLRQWLVEIGLEA